jgi:hypothetical protein
MERASPNRIPDQQTVALVQQQARGLNKWGESLTQTDPFTKQSGETIRTTSPADQSYTTLLASSLLVSQAGGIHSKGSAETNLQKNQYKRDTVWTWGENLTKTDKALTKQQRTNRQRQPQTVPRSRNLICC